MTIEYDTRLWLSWIERSATNRKVGGSNPSRRNTKPQASSWGFFVTRRVLTPDGGSSLHSDLTFSQLGTESFSKRNTKPQVDSWGFFVTPKGSNPRLGFFLHCLVFFAVFFLDFSRKNDTQSFCSAESPGVNKKL